MKRLALLVCSFALFGPAFSQVAKTQVVQLNVDASDNSLTIKWPAEPDGFTGNYEIRRRTELGVAWGDPIATLAGNEKEYVDKSVESGTIYEYYVAKVQNAELQALGYISSGNKLVLSPIRKGLILLIDSTMMDSLAAELDQYQNDASSEGYAVHRIYAGRSEKPHQVKKRIKDLYESENENIGTMFIVGHVPVPYSGDFKAAGTAPPDGHVEGAGNHTGAWAADAYYGDMDGSWNDLNVNNVTGARTANHNVPGDGKFDENKIPSDIELEVGRVDLISQPDFLDLSGYDEVDLLRNYFKRNHLWRTDQWRMPERGLIRNNFQGFNLASSGYHNFSAMFPVDSVHETELYFPTLWDNGYVWSYACGPGSYNSCSKVGRTRDWAVDTVHSVFTMLAGSYFGDWDSDENFLRAPLGSASLATMWAGLPKWYVHHMAMGETIGFGARISQNNDTEYFNGQFNNTQRGIHIALMGDPTLRLRNMPPVDGLTAVSSNEIVDLNWNKASGEFDGYVVYRIDSEGDYTLLTTEPQTDTFYQDEDNWRSGDYTYAVFTSRLETTASGSYYNIGGGSRADVSHVSGTSIATVDAIEIYPNPVHDVLNLELETHQRALYIISGLDGKRVAEGRISSTTEQVSVSNLRPGVYMISVQTEGGLSTTRFIKS